MNILLKNVLLDSENKEQWKLSNLAIKGSKIVALSSLCPEEIDYIIDIKGRRALPGLIDFHTHLFKGGSGFGLNPDLLFATGVTTAVDMGSAGRANFEVFHKTCVEQRQMRVKAFLNISPIGQPGAGIAEPLQEACFLPQEMENVLEHYQDVICGLKVRISKEIVGELGLTPLKNAIALGEQFHLPVCVHTTNPPSSTEDIARLLRPGDIYSHTYQGKGHTIIDAQGKVFPALKQAQKDGVLFEVGQGRYNLDENIVEKALADNFYPDIISTDATPRTMFIAQQMRSLPNMMSKFLHWGMSWSDVIKASIVKPAELLGKQRDLATLEPGTTADLVIFDFQEKGTQQVFVPYMTITQGQMVYCQTNF